MLAGIAQPALLRQHAGIAQLRADVLLARADRTVPFQRLVVTLALLVHLPEIKPHRIRILVVLLERTLELRFSRIVIVQLHRKQRHCHRDFGIFRILREQHLELLFRFREFVFVHQHARVA